MRNLLLAAALALATPAFAGATPTLTAAKVAEIYAKEPIPAQFNPATHSMPSNLIIKYVDHSKFRGHCRHDLYGCEISPAGRNSLTYYYIFIDLDTVPPALRPTVLRHEKAHVLGWRH